ncbi:MAG: type III pantothenate kinase [Alphaproteobacteria bacterium]
MILCIDIGNTQIHAGVFKEENLILQFRYSSSEGMSSDQLGIFLKNILREHNLDPKSIHNITICSVVPELDYSVRSACIKYFQLTPFFLNVGVKTGLKIKYSNPAEVGADRIATAVGANCLHPNQNIVIVDMGTATTIDIVNKEKEYLGGAILPGLKSSVKALYINTSKLPSVEIVKPKLGLGKSTKENIQIGLFYGQLGAIKELIAYLTIQSFPNEEYIIIATGGFSEVYRNENIFEAIYQELAFVGLRVITNINKL